MRQGQIWISRLNASAMTVAVATLSLSMLAGVGCGNERRISDEQAEKGLALPDSTSTTRKISLGNRCKLDEVVKAPAEGTPEWVVQQVYEAAAADEDNDANFGRFYAHFDASIKKDWARKQYWPRIRRTVEKYLIGDKAAGAEFKICRREKKDGTVKMWIHSQDDKKSNPPVTVAQDDAGKWKITFFSY
ncbi:MAG: hypothetical protein ACI9MR_000292 [Myxococcota bacterium]|jgi:hypothetical protein